MLIGFTRNIKTVLFIIINNYHLWNHDNNTNVKQCNQNGVASITYIKLLGLKHLFYQLIYNTHYIGQQK